jgi:hypothetical protein
MGIDAYTFVRGQVNADHQHVILSEAKDLPYHEG